MAKLGKSCFNVSKLGNKIVCLQWFTSTLSVYADQALSMALAVTLTRTLKTTLHSADEK